MLALACLFFLLTSRPQQPAMPPTTPVPGNDALKRADEVSFKAGGGVPPVLLYSVKPEFTEPARKKHISGDVLITLLVNKEGRPLDVRVLKGLGLGLDEKAVEAVRQYRFKPATDAGGTAVERPMTVHVNFQIF